MRKFMAVLCLGLAVPMTQAEETNEIEQLKRQMEQMQQNFEKARHDQQDQVEALKKKLDELTKQQASEAEKKKIEAELAEQMQTNSPATNLSTSLPAPPWSASQPITVARAGSAYMNISFDVLMDVGSSTESDPGAELELGDHDPHARGFNMPNAEIALDGGIDPYFNGFANIVWQLDTNSETTVELEEAYLQTTDLPINLQAKAGQYFAAFGRENPQHPHQWAFVDAPIILVRTLGPDGLRNLGAQLSWLAPTPNYTELSLGIMNGVGETAFSFRNPGTPNGAGVNTVHGRATIDRTLNGMNDLLYVPRLSSSFDLTDQQTLVAGVSGAFGPNDTGPNEYTDIGGVDVYWKWKAPNAHGGFPFVSLQAEGLYQKFGAGAYPAGGLPQETLRDWGFYSQALWGFKPRWVAGLRGEYANGNKGADDPNDVYRNERMRVSPDITFYPSEFSKFRLQFDYDHGALFGDQYSVWFQIEFLLGAHAAHKF